MLLLGITWRLVVNFMLQPACTWKGTLMPIELAAGLAPKPVWTFWRKKNKSPLPALET
jgi:hypothetical protein